MNFNMLVCVVLTRLILFGFYGHSVYIRAIFMIFFLISQLILTLKSHSPRCCNSLRLYLTFDVLDLYEPVFFYSNVVY